MGRRENSYKKHEVGYLKNNLSVCLLCEKELLGVLGLLDCGFVCL